MGERLNEQEYDTIVVDAGAAGLAAELIAVEASNDVGMPLRVAVHDGNTRGADCHYNPRVRSSSTGPRVAKRCAGGGHYRTLAEVPIHWMVDRRAKLANLRTIFVANSATRYQAGGGNEHIVETLFGALADAAAKDTDTATPCATGALRLVSDEDERVAGVSLAGHKDRQGAWG